MIYESCHLLDKEQVGGQSILLNYEKLSNCSINIYVVRSMEINKIININHEHLKAVDCATISS